MRRTLAIVGILLSGAYLVMGCSNQDRPKAEEQKALMETHMESQTQEAIAQVKDLVCGMAVTTDSPHRAMYEEKTYYFCSVGCKERFLENPQKFVAH